MRKAGTSGGGGHARDVDVVLDREGQAVQRQYLARGLALLEHARGRQQLGLGRQVDPNVFSNAGLPGIGELLDERRRSQCSGRVARA